MSLARFQHQFSAWLQSGNGTPFCDVDDAARAGLDVYLNNYRTQLLRLLHSSFPFTEREMGETIFARFAQQCIVENPPINWSIDVYGNVFFQFLANQDSVPRVAADMAALEWAIRDAGMAQDRLGLTPAMLAMLDWENTKIHHAAGGQTFAQRSNAADRWAAHSRNGPVPEAEQGQKLRHILVWRDQIAPCLRELDEDEAEIFAAMNQPLSIADICTILARDLGEAPAISRAGQLIARWAADGCVSTEAAP